MLCATLNSITKFNEIWSSETQFFIKILNKKCKTDKSY